MGASAFARPQALGPIEQAQQDIDATLWQPFNCAFEAMDGVALNQLYAHGVIRVTPDGIDTQSRFKAFNETRFDAIKRSGGRITLDFWFDSRATNSNTSYEVGFFRLGTVDSAGATDYYHGQFHIVLQKHQGRWQIIQDWDTGSIAGREIDAEMFSRRAPETFACP